MLQVLEHKKGVTCFTAIMVSDTDALFASTSSDGVVNVWEVILPSSSGGEWLGVELCHGHANSICINFAILYQRCLVKGVMFIVFKCIKYIKVPRLSIGLSAKSKVSNMLH